MPLAVAFRSERFLVQGDVCRIGSSPQMEISLPAANLASHQATLKRVAGRWLLETACEDLLRVEGKSPSPQAWVKAGDRVFLGSLTEPITLEVPVTSEAENRTISPATTAIPPAMPAVVPSAGKGTSPAVANVFDASKLRPWLIGGPVVCAILLAGFFLVGRLQQPSRHAEENPAGSSRREVPSAPAEPTDAPSTVASEPSMNAGFEGIYHVRARKEGDPLNFEAGLAVAIGRRRLLTTGGVAINLNQLKKQGQPKQSVQIPLQNIEIPITRIWVHPRLEGIRSRIVEMEERYANTPPSAEVLAEHRQALADEKACDIAVLEVGRDLSALLPLGKVQDDTVPPNAPLVVLGAPKRFNTLTADIDRPLQPKRLTGTMRERRTGSEAARGYWLLDLPLSVSSPPAPTEENWIGSPVLDGSGHVVGIYSVPVEADNTAGSVSILHAVTPITGLRDFPDL